MRNRNFRPKALPTLARSGLILLSPRRVFRKREFSQIRLETFGNFCLKKSEQLSPEASKDEKSPHLAGLCHQENEILQKQECGAGAGGIEPRYGDFELD
jgi:hypothetical protein